jgi:protein O-GlcNAc transferase
MTGSGAVAADRPVLRLIHHLARTGGTTISKCLAVMPEVALLSEIHPLGIEKINPLHQAMDWFGLVDQAEIDRLGSPPDFAASIRLIASRASARGLRLVIRDWAHLDFAGAPIVDRPAFRLSTAEALSELFRLRQIATVRHPIDHWQSLRRVPIMRGKIDLDRFLKGYRRFAEIAAPMGFVRYEDFCSHPDEALQRLCEALDLAYDASWRLRWAGYDRITGDDAARRGSGELRQPRRRPLEPGLADSFLRHPDYQPALTLLGYRHPI